jgi:hypothetical protein
MKAKRNRYDLSLWDVRKLSLYGRARESVQAATRISCLSVAPGSGFDRAIAASGHQAVRRALATDFLYLNQDGIKRGGVAHAGKFF